MCSWAMQRFTRWSSEDLDHQESDDDQEDDDDQEEKEVDGNEHQMMRRNDLAN